MTDISRRTLLAAGAGLLAGASSPGLAAAQTAPSAAPPPAAPPSLPSVYRYKVGDVVVTALSDGMNTIALSDTFVRNQPREAVNAALRAAFLPENQLSLPFTVLLLDFGGRLVLIDTGNGPAKGTVGQLQGNLAAAGIAPGDVSDVVISHFHGDHINGLLDAEGRPAFPKAQVRVPEREWAFWMDDGQMSRAPDALKGGFQNVRRVFRPFEGKAERFAWDKEIVPGLVAVGTPGHTPGHTSFALGSGDKALFIQSDLSNIPALFVRNPSWHVMFDMDPVAAAEVRRKTYDRLAAERIPVAGYHFPFPGALYLEADGDGFRFTPVPWRPFL